MRSAARSNWLATMAFPDIALRGVAGAVTGPPSESGLEATAGEAGRRVLRFRQCVGDVDATRAAAPGVGEHADHVRRSRRRCGVVRDRKSTRLNSSHLVISYAVFCLKKKK